MKAIVLAGGAGERFWPLSTLERPKQFLDPFGKGSLLRMTYSRLRERFDSSDIAVITSSEHVPLTMEELPELGPESIIGEPNRRNTCPACALACLLFDDDFHFVVPADHYMPSTGDLWNDLDIAKRALLDREGLMTFGVEAKKPHTGYGYIELGERVEHKVHKVASFKEKPDARIAEGFVRSNKYLWNSGMFLWRPKTFLSELSRASPGIFGAFSGCDPLDPPSLNMAYSRLPSISVDHAVLERSENVMVVRSALSWSDLGSWSAVKELSGGTPDEGNDVLVGSRDVLIKRRDRRPIAIVGLEDVIVVDAPDGLLVCSGRSAQDVRQVRRKISERSR